MGTSETLTQQDIHRGIKSRINFDLPHSNYGVGTVQSEGCND